jgi:hypothetical protein
MITCRNFVVLVGAYYLSIVIGMPLFIGFGHLFEGRPVSGDLPIFMNSLLWSVPSIVEAAIAGLIAGWLIEAPSRARWPIAFGAMLFVLSILSHHWKVRPGWLDLSGEFASALLEALAGGVVLMVSAQRFGRFRQGQPGS